VKNNSAIPFLIISLLFFSAGTAHTQAITAADKKKLQQKEDSLKILAKTLITDSSTAGRMIADSQFVKTLLRALQVKNSFFYPFDSVKGISKLYAPDTSFRIFTWSIEFDEYYSRQRGAIQLRTKDGSLNLISLRDYSEFTENPLDSIRTRYNWIGAVYYNIIKTQHRGKNYYTLFGYDNNSVMSNKKWIEVLSFDEKNYPVFGGHHFTFQKDSIPKPAQHRFMIEYKKKASALVNYIPDFEMILVDHLISETDEPENKWTLIPDGDYEGFKWENGKWVHIEKVFDFKLKDGEAPVEFPIFDPKGKKDEKKLQEQSDKNKSKGSGKERIPINYDN
jgi:hypothetical protein